VAAGPCDVTESCTGSAPNCPTDAFASSATLCRASAGACDVAEVCDGASVDCPADVKSTAVCRPSAGICDVAETCNGVADGCPVDAFQPSTTICRPSADVCDLDETCTGASTTCPADTGLPDTDSDTVCDAIDNCDGIANTSQDNNDTDPLGDACDPCTNLAPTAQSKAKLIVSKLLDPAGDDRIAFASFFTSVPTSPTIDPVVNGARFLVTDGTGAIPIDITIPGGGYDPVAREGWKVNGAGTSWTYQNSGMVVPSYNGITKIQIKAVPSTPGKFKVGVKGRNGTYPVNAANLPLMGTIIVDVPYATTGQCGEARFPEVPPAKPSCVAASGGHTVRCK
jgi:hypothetical protein